MRPFALLALCLLFISFAAPAADADRWSHGNSRHHVEGSGDFETRTYDLSDFDAIRIDGVFEIEVTAGEDYEVKVEAEDNLFEYIIVETKRGELVLDLENDVEIETDESILVMISMPALVEIDGNGVYELTATGIDNEKTEIYVQGVGSVELEGRTEDLRVESNGVGEVDLRDLVAQTADVRVEGIGDVYVFVEQDLRARVSGLGDVVYGGNPESVDDRVDGFGSIEADD